MHVLHACLTREYCNLLVLLRVLPGCLCTCASSPTPSQGAGKLISVRLVSPLRVLNTPCKIIWSARQGDPDQPLFALLPTDNPPKRRWRFASPNANSMLEGSSASAQRGEKQKEQVRQRRDKPTSCRLGAVNILMYLAETMENRSSIWKGYALKDHLQECSPTTMRSGPVDLDSIL